MVSTTLRAPGSGVVLVGEDDMVILVGEVAGEMGGVLICCDF